nr:NAD(P)H-hydrate dehydratase [Roseibaca sp. Y0-43]
MTSAQMRAIEGAVIDSGAVTGLALMERAGQSVLDAIFGQWPDMARQPGLALVLCGPGNNGGDGFVIARLLAGQGWRVRVALLGDPSRLSPDAQINHDRWVQGGGVVQAWAEAVAQGKAGSRDVTLLIDALFGTGLTRPLGVLHDDLSRLLAPDMAPRPKIIAVDVPSGLCADSGRVLGPMAPFALRADLTVSFHRMKLGHVLADGPELCGKVVVADIGLSSGQVPGIVQAVTRPEGARLDKHMGHKFNHGHALVLSGGAGRTGAARLAARGALRMGAGLVTLGVPGAALFEVAAQITALMLTRIDTAESLAQVLQDTRINALCLGPGLGVEAEQTALIEVALDARRPTVLDADALTCLAQTPELFAKLHDTCVLTPHMGEFARLFPDIAAKLSAPPLHGPAYSKVDATRAAAARVGCVVLLKGPDTVIAAPDGQCRIHAAAYDRAAPWLATAGAGDALAGFIIGLLARGQTPLEAACTAAWLHVDCARAFGPGLIAEDLPEVLPRVLAQITGQA